MKSLYDPAVADEVRQRVARLQSTTTPAWGKMTVAQALAHCAMAMENALGDTTPPRHPLGRLIGGILKRRLIVQGKPMGRSAPTHPTVLVEDERNFETERKHLQHTIDRFTSSTDACTRHPHFFFGPMTPAEWATFMYVHLDHHLRQFNV